MRNDLVERFPLITGVIDLESEPARKLIEAFAYRELELRARINDAARAVLLASSWGTNLDHLGALFATARQEAEGDQRFRRRIQLAPEAFSVAGPEGAYQYHALTVAPWARDVTAVSRRPGVVRITVLKEGTEPNPTAAEREAIRLHLASAAVRPLTDVVEVLAPVIRTTRILARLTLYHGPDGEVVRQRALSTVTSWVEKNRMLGMNLRRSALYAALHQEGVHSVDLISPTEDLVLDVTEVYSVDTIEVTIASVRDE
jgi:phage-related baseplate assembly protein